jgi:hypothetical protein
VVMVFSLANVGVAVVNFDFGNFPTVRCCGLTQHYWAWSRVRSPPPPYLSDIGWSLYATRSFFWFSVGKFRSCKRLCAQ